MLKILLTAASGAVLLSACATMQGADTNLAQPEAAPAEWAAVDASTPPTGDWVGAFNDAILTSLISEAIANNYDIAAAAARVEQARALSVQANAQRLPTLDADVGATGTSAENAATGRRNESTSYSAGLSASWEADVWGRLSDQARAAATDVEASKADLEAARLSIAGAVAQRWFELIEARLQTDLARRDVENRERSLRFIERRYSRGVSTSLDVRLARSALASSRAQLYSQIQFEDSAARAVEVLLGRYPGAELEAVASLPDLHALKGAGAPGELLVRRPDLRAAEARLTSAGLRASQARKALLPRLTLTGTADLGGPDIEDLLDVDTLVARLIGNVAQPIFRGGSLRAEATRQEAVARERLASYANAALFAWQEAENALEAEILLADREAALEEAAEEAARAEELAERQYNNGLRTIFDLLDAQARRITSESQYLTASRQRVSNRVQLYMAIGGDFNVPANEQDEARQSEEQSS